jgi:hypothetical protein
MYSRCTFKQVNVLRKLKCYLCKQTLSNICLTCIRINLEYACEVLVEHNLQVEILFPIKQGGNIYLLGVNIASWQHFTKCLIHYNLKFWVIVYLLQYYISMITISETMKTMQHHGLVDIGHHFESCTVATTTRLTVMEYLCHKWPRIYFNGRSTSRSFPCSWLF